MYKVAKWAGILFAAGLAAQEQPLIRVNTRLVEVDVVVKDKNGPVADLTLADFTVRDQGKPQKIASFAVRSQFSATPNASLPPGAASNRGNSPGGATIFLLDMLNTADADQSYARQQVGEYLETAPKGDAVAIYSLGKTLAVVRDLSRQGPEHSPDQGADDLAADLLATAPDLGDPIANAMQSNSIKEMQDAAIKNRALITARALELIAKYLRGLPGRKKLVWVSSSFPAATTDVRQRNGRPLIEHQEFGNEIDHAVHALNDANVAVYAIDPRNPYDAGLMAPGIDTMNLFAGGTGGQAFYSITDLAGAMRTAVQDTEVTYVMGFYPDDIKLDGSYHPLSVKVARSGVEIRARKGYYAAESKAPSEKQRLESMNEVLSSPLDATAIGLTAFAEPAQGNSLVVTFNVGELHMEREGDRWVALIDFAAYFPDAKKPNAMKESIKLSLTEQRFREALAHGYTMRRPLNAGNHTGMLRVAVQDRVSGAIGSVRLKL